MVHQYKLGEYNIVLDICSGSVHAVDEVAYDIIEIFEKKSKDEIISLVSSKYADREDITASDIEECYSQVEALKEAGKLFQTATVRTATFRSIDACGVDAGVTENIRKAYDVLFCAVKGTCK